MNSTVLFSVVVPTFNRSALLKKTLQSLLAQELRDFEIIIVDDGGTDDTKSMVETLSDERVTYFWKENGERGAARNFGMTHARGNWINFFDSDDLAYPNHLSVAYHQVLSNPESAVFHTGYDVIQNGNVVSRHEHEGVLNNRILKGNLLSCNNVFFRRDVLDVVSFKENREMSNAEDWLLWLQVCARYQILGVKTITASIIQHNNRSMVTAGSEKMLKSAKLFEKYLSEDAVFNSVYGRFTKGCIAEVYSLVALGAVLEKNRKQALKWLIFSLKMDMSRVFTRRTAAILTRLVI